MVASMSIWTPRAWPVLGRNSAQGKPVPIISRVSQSSIMSDDGLEPSRPMVPVTQGRSSGSAALPSRALAAPAFSLSAMAMTSSVAWSAPAPTRMATFLPLFSTSAARRRSASFGTIWGFW